MRLEKVYERLCGMIVCDTPGKDRMREFISMYDRLGKDAEKLDNMVYEHIGVSCEDVIRMLENPDMKI